MSTTLENAMIELSKQLGDYHTGTTTSAGAAGGTTVIDTALKAKANDWVETGEAYTRITSGTYDEQERKISSLDNSTGTLTTLAHGGQIASGVTYEVHRLFTADKKREALVWAARNGFPNIFQEVWDESLVSGNWLKDGSFESWSSATALSHWIGSNATLEQTTTASYYKHGSTSCKLQVTIGPGGASLYQNISKFEDLQFLRGKNATFTCQGHCNKTTALRLSINDGTTQTYSDYHAGDSAWTEDDPRNDSFYVTQYIDPNATEVTCTIHLDSVLPAPTAYVDDARLLSYPRGRLYIGTLGLHNNHPHRVEMEPSYYSQEEEWLKLAGWTVDETNGYLYLPTRYQSDRRLRIRGLKTLDFLSSGSSSTDWSATIALDQPQLDILVAQAAFYLYGQMIVPNFDTGENQAFSNAYAYWRDRLAEVKAKHARKSPPATIHFGWG
jgi:hypothetical protein